MTIQVHFLNPKVKTILAMVKTPKLVLSPTKSQFGIIQVGNRSVSLRGDYTFSYGAWPQKKVPVILNTQLNQLLRTDKIRKNGHYYSMNHQANHEYNYQNKRYVLMTGEGKWREVSPVIWHYDIQKGLAYTDADIFEQSAQGQKTIGWQIMQSNKFVREHATPHLNDTLKEATAQALHAIRFLRDVENQRGQKSALGHQIYELCKITLQQKRYKKRSSR